MMKYLKIMVRLFFLTIFCLMTFMNSMAQEHEEKQLKRWSIIGIPILYVSPESGLSGGLGGFLNYRADPTDTITNPSNISLVALISTKLNYQVDFGGEHYSFQNRRRVTLDLKYKFQPEEFHGIGQQAIPTELYELTTIRAEFAFYQQIEVVTLRQKFYLGPRIIVEKFNVNHFSPDGVLDISGDDGGFLVGAGLHLNYDSRDNIYYPLRGSYVEVKNYFYQQSIGSEFSFNNYILDARTYFKIYKKQVIALQYYSDFNFGDVPFTKMGMLGGSKRLRGIYEGRFRDNNAIMMQGEYRLPVFWRIGIHFFGGIGRVAEEVKDFDLDRWHSAFGAGLRYTFNEAEHTNARVDVGYSRYDGLGFYLTIKEAF